MKPLCVWWINCLLTFVSLPIATNAVGITVLEGDVYVEGVFSLHTIVNNTCIQDQVEPEFVQNMESIRWTFQQLNKFESNLYGKKIGMYMYYGLRYANTCLRAYMDSDGPDQPADSRRLHRTFTVRTQSLDTSRKHAYIILTHLNPTVI